MAIYIFHPHQRVLCFLIQVDIRLACLSTAEVSVLSPAVQVTRVQADETVVVIPLLLPHLHDQIYLLITPAVFALFVAITSATSLSKDLFLLVIQES